MFQTIVTWLVTSSKDPRKFSLAVNGFLIMAGGYALHAAEASCQLGLYCIGVDQEVINSLVSYGTDVAYAVMFLTGAVLGAVGLLRKIVQRQWSAAPSPIQTLQ